MDLQTFCFENQTIRTKQINNEIWFVGKDVAEILGYSNASKAVIDHVDNEDKTSIMVDMADSQNGNLLGKTKTTMINESGLYSLILSSKLPKAKDFKRWITSEVLPTIRKTGKYENHISSKPTRTTERTAEVMLDWAKTVIKELLDKEDYNAKYEIFTYCSKAAGLTDFPIPNYTTGLLCKDDIPPSVRNILIRLDSTVKNEDMSYNRLYKEVVAQYGICQEIKKNTFWKILLQWADSKRYTVRFFRSNGDKKITFVDSNGYVVLGTEKKGVTIC